MAHEGNNGDVFFNIDSRLLYQLGENLVTNRAVALAELVKNSYDADALSAVVQMENIKNPGGTIVVKDNGSGMTLSIFKKTWMRIATIDKEENPFSKKYKRKRAGEKGIGRFACRRLSKRLTIKSVAETENGHKEELNATFDWTVFTPGSDVDKIPVKYNTKPVDNKIPTGTTLILEDTNESWNTKDIKQLRNELTELFSPITFKLESELKEAPEKYDPGFNPEFICHEFPGKEEPLDETFLKNAWAKLIGFVDEEGFATYKIEVIKPMINKIERTFKRDKAFKYLKNTKLEVYIFSYSKKFFRGSEWGKSKSESIGRERGGIKVYADNFRVFGYGVKGDDWLRLDYDRARSIGGVDKEVTGYTEEDNKRPGLHLFMNRSLFGHVVFIKNDNTMLKITVNRERLTNNGAFEELRNFVRLGVDFSTVLYANEVSKRREEKRKKEEAVEEERRRVEEEVRRKAEEYRRRAEEIARKAEEYIRKVEEIARKAEEDRRKAEEEREKAEEYRRRAEEVRRKAEEKARKSTEKTILKEATWKKAKVALREEEERLKAEEKAIKREEEIRKWAEEKRRRAEEVRRRAEEEKRKAEILRRRAEIVRRRVEEEKVRRKKEKYDRELSQLRVLASTGTLVLIFSHELQALIEDMEEMTVNFASILKKLPEKEQMNYTDTLESFSKRTEMIKELGEFLGLTIGRESRLEKKEWVLSPIVESVFHPFRWYLTKLGIEYRNSIPNNLRTPIMYRSELVSILHNLMSNAFKAVKGKQDRRIEVTGFEEDDCIHIWFLDSGEGLDSSLREKVFEPFESFSEPDLRFGAGTGLGLKIVRDIIRAYGGDVRFIDAHDNWKTCVEINLPTR